jgi:uncharacterized metal-binding protein YceD (DUF177 family)
MTWPLVHLISVTSLSNKGRNVAVTATAIQLVDIAKYCKLKSIEAFRAEFQVTKGRGQLIEVQGCVVADVIQTCGVTLEPIEEHVDADVSAQFTLELVKIRAEVDLDPRDEDPPEPVFDGQIDFGALALEHLVLNLIPYPRVPDAAFQANNAQGQDSEVVEGDEKGENPFAVLSSLKKGLLRH